MLFNDADDPSDPRRLEQVRTAFAQQPAAGVVYSSFRVIDQDGVEVSIEAMTASVAEVLKAHRHQPPQGDNTWIAISTRTGYINHTSFTACEPIWRPHTHFRPSASPKTRTFGCHHGCSDLT
ncbi:MAG TPA: hypothetical protein VFU22_23500 [Roseiflexaceae bacterium]|nr:hypothetical protein [Roseiflexaceae bacterium]